MAAYPRLPTGSNYTIERNIMKTETVELNGVPISKETILGWAAQCGVKIEPPKPEPYQFKVRDVAKSRHGLIKIILKDIEGNLVAYGIDGYLTSSGGQKAFERFGYVKIGELPDLLKVPEPKEVAPQSEFKPISVHRGCFVVSVEKGVIIIKTGSDYKDNGCRSCSYTAREFIKALQSAIDFVERNGK